MGYKWRIATEWPLRRTFKKILYWAFNRYYLNTPGIHIITAINVAAKSYGGKIKGEIAVRKFLASQSAAEDRLKAELTDIAGGGFEQVDNLHDE